MWHLGTWLSGGLWAVGLMILQVFSNLNDSKHGSNFIFRADCTVHGASYLTMNLLSVSFVFILGSGGESSEQLTTVISGFACDQVRHTYSAVADEELELHLGKVQSVQGSLKACQQLT